MTTAAQAGLNPARLARIDRFLTERYLGPDPAAHGWRLAGGTHLFRLYHTPDAETARDLLARAGIWGRIFPWHPHWLRLGIPGNRAEFARLEAALTAAG